MTIIHDLKNQIKVIQDKINSIQESCNHPKECLIKLGRGNTGNYDRDDIYWYECHCQLCDKKWHEDQ